MFSTSTVNTCELAGELVRAVLNKHAHIEVVGFQISYLVVRACTNTPPLHVLFRLAENVFPTEMPPKGQGAIPSPTY